MFSLFDDDQFIDDVVNRAEQSRQSYNIQTEEFRTLNTNLQTYLNDMKTMDGENRQLQEHIEQIRKEYISALENHLKRLPNDFREQSQTLNEAHLERYQSKTRAKRYLKERDELKRRIHFVASNEKEQVKRLNALQKQERIVRNEFNKLNQQIQTLLVYVDNEKQNYQQAMDKVDNLQIQLERICIERSKTEFEIQTLKEEVKLMQTTKEFLDEERETILETQAEANEYLLSRLSESINRIRQDFNDLNQTQLKQMDNEYKQMLQILEESVQTNETNTFHQSSNQEGYEQLHDEHQTVLQELTTLNDHNQTLIERVQAMEAEFFSLRDERRQQLTTKDNELECSKLELQTLKDKLNHLAEYDRNLKFELTLYRGVLESEYRRKQSTSSITHLMRPTSLRSNSNTLTDRTVWSANNTNQSKLNDQQQDENLTVAQIVQSNFDLLSEDNNIQTNNIYSIGLSPTVQNNLYGQQQIVTSDIDFSQNNEKTSNVSASNFTEEDHSSSVTEAQQLSSRTSSTSTAIRQSPTSSTSPALLLSREEQSETSQLQRSPVTTPELQSTPTSLPSIPILEADKTIPQGKQTSTDSEQITLNISDSQRRPSTAQEHPPSSRTSSVSSTVPSDVQRHLSTSSVTAIPEQQKSEIDAHQSPSTPSDEHQSSSRKSSTSAVASSDNQRRSSTINTSPIVEQQQQQQPSSSSSRRSSTSSSHYRRPSTAGVSVDSEQQSAAADTRQTPLDSSEERQPSSRKSSLHSSGISDVQRQVPVTDDVSLFPEQQTSSSHVEQSSSSSSGEHQPSSRSASVGSGVSVDVQRRVSTSDSSPVADVTQPLSPSMQEHLSPSRKSSVDSTLPSSDQKRSSVVHISTADEQQPSDTQRLSSDISSNTQRRISASGVTISSEQQQQQQPTISDVRQLPALPSQEYQSSSRKSSVASETLPDIHKETVSTITSATSEQEPSASRKSSIDSVVQSDGQRRTSTSSIPIVPDQQLPTSTNEPHSSTHTSSVSSSITPDASRRPSVGHTSTVLENQPSSRKSSVNDGVTLSTTQTNVEEEQPISSSYEHQFTSRKSSTTSLEPSENRRRSSVVNSSTVFEHPPRSRTSSTGSAVSTDAQRRLSTTNATISPEQQPPSGSTSEHQSTSRKASIDSILSSDFQRSITSATAPAMTQDQPLTSDVLQSMLPSPTDPEASPEVQSSSDTDGSPSTVEGHELQHVVDQSIQLNNERDDNIEHEERTLPVSDERLNSHPDHSEHRSSTSTPEQSSHEEYEVSLDTDMKGSRSSSFNLYNASQEERKQSLSQSDTNLLTQDNKSELSQIESSNQTKREGDSHSSLIDRTEEDDRIDYHSSTKTSDDHLLETHSFPLQDTSKQSSDDSSLTDVEVDATTSENRTDNYDDPKLAVIVQELRYVFHELANNEDVVEIDNDLPDKLLDRLEFRDQLIRTLFDSLFRKYLVEASAQKHRLATLDWIEFRDILFPMVSGRYTEQHIRKLFDLFDISGDGHLSVQEIAELLEVLQANDTIHLAQIIVDKYDTDHDGKLSADELIEAIKTTDDINENVLSKETENQQWFNQSPTENQTIILEVPVINFSTKPDEKFTQEISILGQIFKNVGANSDKKELNSNDEDLTIKITNEFINHNINISNTDLQRFIQLFLNKKQQTVSSINWIEFRDTFLPIVNSGYCTKIDLKRWFEILDTDRTGLLTQEQITLVLRLLQVRNFEETSNKLNATREINADNSILWTFDELIESLTHVDETNVHLLSDNERIEQIASFDTNWLSNNIF
ncbi:hypothetical protein I4U23_019309 [Adineta vaga]|nr:hypothetical protein I4U23_019309 [Adineta vaga]